MSKVRGIASAAICVISLSACASIVSGTYDDIMVNTNPAGADCLVVGPGGETVGRAWPTPASVTVRRGSGDLSVHCAKEGYSDARSVAESGLNGWVFGNIAFGGLIGAIVDTADGAAQGYDESVLVTLPEAIPTTAKIPVEPVAEAEPVS